MSRDGIGVDVPVLVNLKAQVFELGKLLELSIWSILHEGIKREHQSNFQT